MLSKLDQTSPSVEIAMKYKSFLEVASTEHRLDLCLTLGVYMLGYRWGHDICVLETFSGTLIEFLIASVSGY